MTLGVGKTYTSSTASQRIPPLDHFQRVFVSCWIPTVYTSARDYSTLPEDSGIVPAILLANMKTNMILKGLTNSIFALGTAFFTFHTATASTVTINFDGLPDSSDVGSFYHAADGVDFQSDIILTAGISVNTVDYPPHSGTGVIADNGDPLVISFVNPANSISAYFAYNTQLTFSAYDHSGALLETVFSPNTSHLGSDQLISLGFSGVSTLDIAGANDFIMDDLTFTTSAIPNGGSAPERGSTLALLLIASLALALFSRTKSRWPVSS